MEKDTRKRNLREGRGKVKKKLNYALIAHLCMSIFGIAFAGDEDKSRQSYLRLFLRVYSLLLYPVVTRAYFSLFFWLQIVLSFMVVFKMGDVILTF